MKYIILFLSFSFAFGHCLLGKKIKYWGTRRNVLTTLKNHLHPRAHLRGFRGPYTVNRCIRFCTWQYKSCIQRWAAACTKHEQAALVSLSLTCICHFWRQKCLCGFFFFFNLNTNWIHMNTKLSNVLWAWVHTDAMRETQRILRISHTTIAQHLCDLLRVSTLD